jgi:hypothetical protein
MRSLASVKFFRTIKETLCDRYLTWRTGYSKADREYIAWRKSKINFYASTVEEKYKKFKYLIEVDPYKLLNFHIHAELVDASYFYPHKPPGECAVWSYERGMEDYYTEHFNILALGTDRVYVATDDKADAIEIALLFS